MNPETQMNVTFKEVSRCLGFINAALFTRKVGRLTLLREIDKAINSLEKLRVVLADKKRDE